MHSRLVIAIAALLYVDSADAQEKKDSETVQYKVEFNIQDSSDTPKGARRYSMLIDANSKGTFRVGNRVPYTTGTPTAQYQYADVGVNIDTRLRDVGGKVGLNADLELSAIVQNDKTSGATVNPNPTISSFRITINAVVAPGKRTQVASVDDPITMRRFDVDTTITRAN